MTKTCFVCLNSYKKEESRSFHMFPKNVTLRKKWFDVLQITGQGLSIYTVVCSDHFKLEDIYVAPTGKRFLKKCAVPSIFTERPISAALSHQRHPIEEGMSQYSGECSLTGTLEKTFRPVTETASEITNLDATDADFLARSPDSEQSIESRKIGTSTTKTASELMDLEQSLPRKESTDTAESRDIGTSTMETAHKLMDLEQSPPRKKYPSIGNNMGDPWRSLYDRDGEHKCIYFFSDDVLDTTLLKHNENSCLNENIILVYSTESSRQDSEKNPEELTNGDVDVLSRSSYSTISRSSVINCRTCSQHAENKYCEVTKKCDPHITFKSLIIQLVPQMEEIISDEDFVCESCSQILISCAKFINKCIQVEADLKNNQAEKEQRDANDNNSEDLSLQDNILTNDAQTEIASPNLSHQHNSEIMREENCNNVDEFLPIPSLLQSTIVDHSIAITLKQPTGVIPTFLRSLTTSGINVLQSVKSTSDITNTKKRLLLLGSHIPTKKYQCPICFKYLENQNRWSHHIRMCSKKFKLRQSRVKQRCSLCDKLVRKLDMQLHLKAHAEGTPLEDTLVHRKCRSRIFKCNTCSNSFASQELYRAHLKVHPAYICHECGKASSSSREFTRHTQSHKEGGYICEVCGKWCQHRNQLLQHQQIHSDTKFMCDKCPKVFKLNIRLKIHLKNCHSTDGEVKCSECPRMFRNYDNLRAHKSLKHSNANKHICVICNEGFSRGDYFKRHMLRHSRGYPQRQKYIKEPTNRSFRCKFCLKEFKSVHLLRQHLLASHTKLSRYKCPLCSQTYANATNRDRHKKTHKHPESHFRCDSCWKWMQSEDELAAHVATHNRPKRHQCKVCQERFVRKYMLDTHMFEKHLNEEDIQEEVNSVLQTLDEYKINNGI